MSIATAATPRAKAPHRPAITTPQAKLAMSGASLEWIAADSFTVDPSYDRPINPVRVNAMAESWKDEAIGVVFSSRREGEELLYLLDGQHRIGALRKLGRKTDLVPTLVFEGLSVADEAQLFVMMNKNRRALAPSELFKASLVEGDPGAKEIQAVMDGLGLKLESFSNDPYAVSAVATVWRIYRAMGAPGVDATLSLCLIAWGDPPPRSAFHQHLILTLSRILYYSEAKIDMERLRQTLSKETPEALISRAKSIVSLQGGDRANTLAEVILNAYNKGLPISKHVKSDAMRTRNDPFKEATRFRRNQKGA